MQNRAAVTAVTAATAAALAGGLAAVLVAADVLHWRASRRRLGMQAARTPALEAVVVLGFRNRGTTANYVNRYRVRAALRSMDPAARTHLLVLCGGAVAGPLPEAELMRRYARSLGYAGAIRLDPESRSTWQNIANAIPLIADADSIKIVSNSLHAEKGRAYLWQQSPELAARLRRGAEHRWGELVLVKAVAAVVGLQKLRRLRG